METIFEKLGGTYRQVGDYLLPNIEAPESPQNGIWNQRLLRALPDRACIAVTHRPAAMEMCDCQLHILDGKIRLIR